MNAQMPPSQATRRKTVIQNLQSIGLAARSSDIRKSDAEDRDVGEVRHSCLLAVKIEAPEVGRARCGRKQAQGGPRTGLLGSESARPNRPSARALVSLELWNSGTLWAASNTPVPP